jgi:hypothetical protein
MKALPEELTRDVSMNCHPFDRAETHLDELLSEVAVEGICCSFAA